MSKTTIAVRCKGAGVINLSALTPIQGALKILTEENYKRFKAELERDGIIDPVSIYEDPESNQIYILDGHQRRETLIRMREEGYIVPPIPVNYVDASSLEDARQLVLAFVSQYGTVNPQGLYDYMTSAGVGGEEMRSRYNFADFDTDSFLKEYYPAPVVDTSHVVLPTLESTIVGQTYAPSQEQPTSRPSILKPSAEIPVSDFQNFDHTCPRCGFGFDGK